MTQLTLKQLEHDVQDFLKFKRAMGYSYTRGEFMLASLKRFARHRLPAGSVRKAKISLEKTAHAWLARTANRKGNTVAQELTVVRQLCLHRRRRDPHGFVPEQAWAPKTELPFLPYIFSRQEVCRLLIAAGRHRRRNIGPVLMRTLLLILYCTGLRFGEAVRLRLSDINLERRTFFIRESKGRSRIVAFGDDLAEEIKRWLVERDRIVSAHGTEDPGTLLLRRNGQALSLKAAGDAITRLVRNEGLKPARGRVGPRPYDWRHAFAVHRLTDWYKNKVDIHARLPWLSAYMGHVNVLGTEVYLHATPELLRLASQRFAARLQAARGIQ
jgi:site-specific recombinase XerD